jgi:hypothetical protein
MKQDDVRITAARERQMKEAAPPSVLGDVEDAVTPDVDGELTPWIPGGEDEEAARAGAEADPTEA